MPVKLRSLAEAVAHRDVVVLQRHAGAVICTHLDLVARGPLAEAQDAHDRHAQVISVHEVHPLENVADVVAEHRHGELSRIRRVVDIVLLLVGREDVQDLEALGPLAVGVSKRAPALSGGRPVPRRLSVSGTRYGIPKSARTRRARQHTTRCAVASTRRVAVADIAATAIHGSRDREP